VAIKTGDKIENLSLYDSEKELRNINEWSGKRVLIAFFPGAFTGVCDNELCSLDSFSSFLDDLDAAVIGVSVDSPFVLKNWSEQTKTNITLLSDYNREWIDHFGVEFNDLGGLSGYRVANRVVIIIEADGTVSYRWDAENPGVEPDYDELKAKLTS